MSDVYLWETYDKLGREALDRGDLDQANEAFRSAIATAEELQTHDRLVLSLRNLAATMQDMNQMADAHELLVRTLEVAQQQLGKEHSQTVETLRDLSQLSQQLGYLDKADEALKLVLEQDIKSQSADRIGSTLLSLARLAQSRNEPAIAAAYLQRVVKLNRQKHGDNHPEVAQSLLWLATALYQCGKKDEAQSFMRTAFGLMERHFGDEPMHLAQSLLAGAKLMVDAGQLEPALVHQKRALDLLNKELEPENERLWETREYIATTLAAMGKLEEAIEILEFCFRHGNPQGARAGATYKNLAGLYLALDQKEKAEGLYLKASEVLEATLGIEHPAYLATQEERIQLYHFSGRSKEALEVALKTIRATEKRFGTGHPNTAQAYASTALLAHGAEEWQTALELMKAAEKIWSSLDPRPEDVLANCHANIATCLIRMNRFAEAEPSLVIAESWGNDALKPVLAELRAEMANGGKEAEEPLPEPELVEVESADDLFGGADDDDAEELFNEEQAEVEAEGPTTPLQRADLDEHEPIELFAEEKGTPDSEPEDEESPQSASSEETDDFFAEDQAEIEQDVQTDELFDDEQDDPEQAHIDEETASASHLDGEQDDPEVETDGLFGEELDAIEQSEPDAAADELFGEEQAELEPGDDEIEGDELFSDDQDPNESEADGHFSEEQAEVEQDAPEAESDGIFGDGQDPGAPDSDEEVENAGRDPDLQSEEEFDGFELFGQEEDQEVIASEQVESSDEEPEPVELSAEEPQEETPESMAAEDEPDEFDLFDNDGDKFEAAESEEPEASDDDQENASSDLDASDDFFSEDSAEDSDELFSASEDDDDSLEIEPAAAVAVEPINHPDSPNFVERRSGARRPLSFNQFFKIQVASETGSAEEHKSFLVDLGEGGIRINSETPFPMEYDLTLTFPEEVLGESAELACQVVWQKALYGASFIQGLAFQNLTDEQKKLIEAKLNPENGVPRSASRQHFRLYRPFPIKLQAEGHDDWVTSYATDLSVNGIGTRLKAPLEQGNPIRLRLELEFELPTVEVEARVAWSKSGENGVSHGLQFAEVGPVEARTIKRYIDRCLEFLPD
ncbi:MAG: tetratricopeptide repeat protein [Candidatus Eremiobacteraeota bacterium]|nr:tetratricopeptide repeat protein [Candidatus Eremiobacteraeota bacterium]